MARPELTQIQGYWHQFSTYVPCIRRAMLLLTLAIQYTNTWWSAYLPCVPYKTHRGMGHNITFDRMMSRSAFDNRGQEYNVSAILTPEGTLDMEKYKQYSPLFLSYAFKLYFARIALTVRPQHGICNVLCDELREYHGHACARCTLFSQADLGTGSTLAT